MRKHKATWVALAVISGFLFGRLVLGEDFTTPQTRLVAVEHVQVVESRRASGGGNFTAFAPDRGAAERLAAAAEDARRELSLGWYGETFPDWPQRTSIRYSPGKGSGYARTAFNAVGAYVFEIAISGVTLEDAMRDTLPHEVMHAILHTRLGTPPIKWLDEGLATNSESLASIRRRDRILLQRLDQGAVYKLRALFSLKDYPPDPDVYYPESCSITRYLLMRGGIEHLEHVARRPAMSPDAVAQHYGYDRVEDLEAEWIGWVREGSPITEERMQCGPSGCSPMMGRMMGQGSRIPPGYGGVPSTSAPVSTPPSVAAPVATPKSPIGSSPAKECDPEALREAIRDELASIEYPPGPPGPEGPEGPPGRDAEITSEHLVGIADRVLDAIRTDEAFRGQDGRDGRDAELTQADIDAIVVLVGDAVAGNEELAQRLADLVVTKLPPIKVDSYDREKNLLQSREYPYPGPINLRFGVLPE